jgi:protein dithiol:quinone oxidoreductase
MSFLFKNPRRVYGLMIAYSAGLMTIAFFFQYYLLLEPCMLCYLQRFAAILVGLIGLVGFIHNSKRIIVFRSYLGISIVSVLVGIGLSIRQLYLQSLPAELVPSCAPDMDYLLDSLPFFEVLLMAIQGDGNCAEVLWSFLGISIPGWLLIGFLLVLAYLLKTLLIANEIHSQNLYR